MKQWTEARYDNKYVKSHSKLTYNSIYPLALLIKIVGKSRTSFKITFCNENMISYLTFNEY